MRVSNLAPNWWLVIRLPLLQLLTKRSTNQLRRITMTTLITLYFALPSIFMTAVTVRNIIFGDVV